MSVSCSLCDRKSLLFYPVRYAIACPRGAAKAPGLTGNFIIDGRAPQSVGTAKMTLRALRAGYLYTYDEKRRRLRAYMVLHNGLLWSFPPGARPPADEGAVNQLASGCASQGDLKFMSLGRCIDVEHTPGVDEATNLWIGWSNVMWTKGLVEKALDVKDGPLWRAQHMQCIDIKSLMAGDAPHTGEFEASKKSVAHFSMDDRALKDAFEFSNTPTREESRQRNLADHIGQAMAQTPHKKGFVVAVNDPVGVTNDLSELTALTADAGFDVKMHHGKLIYDLLQRAEAGLRQSAAEGVVFDDAEEKLSQQDTLTGGDPVLAAKKLWRMVKAGGPTAYGNQQRADAAKYGTTQAGRQEAAANRAWYEATHDSDGKQTLDSDRYEKFPDTYRAAVDAYKPTLERLTASHAAWLSSELLAHWMAGVHDPKDLRSGFAYSESVAQCIGKAAATPDCVAILTRWLDKGDAVDLRAIYVRALHFNQEDIANALGRHVKPSDIQIEQALNLYKNALKRADSNVAATLLDRLAVTTANILVSALTDTGRQTARFLAAMRLSIQSGYALKASNVNAHDLTDWLLGQVRQRDVRLQTGRTQTRADALSAGKAATRAARKDATIFMYLVDVSRLEQEGVITGETIKTVKIPLIETAKKWLGSSAPRDFNVGVVTAITQLAACKFAYNDWRNSDEFSQKEATTKLAAAALSVSGTIVETLAETVKRSPTHPLSAFLIKHWAHAEKAANASEKYAKFGRMIGAAGGAVAALYDLAFNARQAYSDGQFLLGHLYVANGLLGICIAASSAFFPAAVIFWPAIIASFALSIAIAIANSSALQNWVSKSYFGLGEAYKTFDEELRAYTHAVGA